MKKEIEEIKDLIEMSKHKDVNISMLLADAYYRGLVAGKDLAKRKAIEAIEEEK